MHAHTAGIILVLCLWNVFDSVNGQTCTYKERCDKNVQVHWKCGWNICVHNMIILRNCDRTAACTNSFSAWSTCTATCAPGGTRTRTRTCTTAGGRVCTESQQENCNTAIACTTTAVDGNWGTWSAFSGGTCSATCCTGTLTETRTRACNNPPASGGGATCPGVGTETRTSTCGSLDTQCPLTCPNTMTTFADTCRRCVQNFYTCATSAVGAAPTVSTCTVGNVWSETIKACTLPAVCEAVEV